MKNNVFLVLFFLITSFLLISCASATNVFDETLPDEEIAVIYWPSLGVYPVSFNGINVNWKFTTFSYWNQIKIPAGDTVFELVGSSTSYLNTVWTYNKIPFSYTFDKGNEYTVLIQGQLIKIYNGKSLSDEDIIITFYFHRDTGEQIVDS